MRQKAMLVHLTAFPTLAPLVGGYLHAYAEAEPDIRGSWDVERYSAVVCAQAAQLMREAVNRVPRVIGFSINTWERCTRRAAVAGSSGLPRFTSVRTRS